MSERTLYIPKRDLDGALHSLEMVYPDRKQPGRFKKRSLRGGRVRDLVWRVGPFAGTRRTYLAEGMSTALALWVMYGRSTFAAFSAHQLPWAAQLLVKRYPDMELVIAGDDDETVRRYANRAARAVGCKVVFPK